MISASDKQLLNNRLEELYLGADSYFRRTFVRPTLSFRRSGRHAGTAFLQQNRINLHPVLFAHNQQAYFSDVLPHEVSHLLVYQLFGRVKPHGKEWQAMMQEVFNCAPETRHEFDLSPLNIPSVRYRCDCGEVELSIRRHNAVVRGQRQYQCRKCRQVLQPAA